MKLFRGFIYLIAVVMLSILANSCQDDEFYALANEENCLKITASFANNSRAIFNEANDEHIDITNYCFVYFNDIYKEGALITVQDLGDDLTTPKYLYLPNSSDYVFENRPFYAILLANITRQQLEEQGMKIGETRVKDLWGMITEVTKNGNNPTDPQSFTWSGFLPVMKGDENLAFTLNPNVAKITATITNNSSESDIISVQIKDVVSSVRVAQNALSKAKEQNKADGNPLMTSDNNTTLDIIVTKIDDGNGGTKDQITYEQVGYLDYELEELELSKNQSRTISWYVPHNQCGTGSRPGNIPANQRPTYIEIGSKRQSDGMQVAYKLYPGTTNGAANYNDINNFDIIADNQYTLNISVSDDGVQYVGTTTNGVFVGNQGNTSNIYVKKLVLPPKNNCYMIHPKYSDSVNPAAVGTSNNTTVYELPIYERINEFWGSTDGDANNVIGDNTEWVADVIWQDINARAIHFTDETGSADQDVFNGKGKKPVYFKLNRATLSASTPGYDCKKDIYGNILVGVKKKGASVYLWSWHLWVTDYNPDVAVNSGFTNKTSNLLYIKNTSENAVGDIDLQGVYYNENTSTTSYESYKYKGMVHHYKSTMSAWTSQSPSTADVPSFAASSTVWDGGGMYDDKWIMDRNLGAQSPNNADIANPAEAFGLYYQYGRKDPFSYNNIYDINGNVRAARWTISSADEGTIQLGVKHPNIFYKVSSNVKWAGSSASSNAWFNPNWNNSGYVRGQKTLFDPCPPGWCIPVHEIYSFTVASTNGDRIEEGKSTHACLEVAINTTSSNNNYIVDPLRGYCNIVSNTNTTNYCKAIYPLAGYVGGDGSTAGSITGFTTSGSSYADAINASRGCIWTLDYVKSSDTEGSGRLLQIQPTTMPLVGADIGNETLQLNGRYFRTHYARCSIRNWNTARGQNVRCIQIPD